MADPETAAIRHDWGQTLTELLNENFLAPYQAWCHQHHVLAGYKLMARRRRNSPATGSWTFRKASRGMKRATGITLRHRVGHLRPGTIYGVPVISAEAWTWIHWLAFRATPLDFKATADEYFLEGINQLVGHG